MDSEKVRVSSYTPPNTLIAEKSINAVAKVSLPLTEKVLTVAPEESLPVPLSI